MSRYIKNLVSVVVLTFCLSMVFSQTPQFYTGNTNSPSNTFPYSTSTGKGIQWLVLPGEFAGAYNGIITKFYSQGTASASVTLTQLTIRMAQDNITTLPTGVMYSPINTLVYSAASVTVTSTAAGWISFTLQNPFPYDPTKSLIIQVDQCGSTGGFNVTNVSKSGYRRTYTTPTGCVPAYSGQDANLANLGIDMSSPYYIDAGVEAITQPTGSIMAGTDTVKCRIKNYGKNNLTSAGIGWSVDDVVQPSPPAWSGNLAQFSSSAPIVLGAFNFPVGVRNIKAWTINPNGMPNDSNKMNDSASVKIMVCQTLLNGNYTVGPPPSDFRTLSEAVLALNSCGINGPVKFLIKAGTYNERVFIGNVPGASAVNTITFEGVSRDSVNVVFSNTSSAENAVFALAGAKYVTIKNLTIENYNATNACGIHLSSKADYNTIENCKIIVNTGVTSSTVNAIVASSAESAHSTAADAANYCVIKDNILIGGYYSIKMYGTSSSVTCNGNQLINNTCREFYYYGIYLYYQRNALIQYNKIIMPRYSYAYGMYLYYSYNLKVDGNYINPGAYGMYVYYCQNVSPEYNLITNNIITNFSNGTYQMGIYNYYSYRTFIYNNSIWMDGNYSSPLSYGCISNYYQQNSITQNNILKCTGNLNCIVVNSGTTNPGDIDYNNYVTGPNAFVFSNGSTTYKTLPIWRLNQPAFNANSIETEPLWVSKTDLHLQGISPTMFGANVGVTKDIDGDDRCDLAATLGADEYPYTPMAPAAGFISEDSTCVNSPIFCRNIASVNDVKIHAWYVNGTKVSNSLNYYFTPINLGIDTVTVITRNCFGADTFSKQIKVGNTSQGPTSDFVVNKNKAVIGEVISFSDLSKGCPVSWEWKIYPDSVFDYSTGTMKKSHAFVNGTNPFTPNPQIKFLYSDSFDISLKTKNSLDSSISYKSNYIAIVATFNLCFGVNETEESDGFLYDNGGSSLSYTANSNCSFYIHPCASNLSLTFNMMDLRQGDYLRIYDGRDNTGTPMWNKSISPKGFGNYDTLRYPTPFDVFKSISGEIYIEFESDASIQGKGFEAVWTSEPGTFSAPHASFNVPDSVCNGSIVVFENTSTGFNNKYYWDPDGDNNNDIIFVTDASYIYKNDGAYNARLMVANCGGFDTFTKSVFVYTSANKPSVTFTASNYRPAIRTEVVTIAGLVLQDCVDTIQWIVSPSTYDIKSGNLNSMVFDLIVKDTGCYDFTMIAGYKGKSVTVDVPCFIRGLDYCLPNFSNYTKDISISRVQFSTIDQQSTTGVKPYEDFTNTLTAPVQVEVPYSFTISRPSINNFAQLKIWIDLNIDGIFDDATELVASDLLSKSLDWTGSILLPLNTSLGKTRMRVGISAIGQTLEPCSILNFGEFEDYSIEITPITTPPTIILNHLSEIRLSQCGSYTEPGAIAFDILGNNITGNIIITGTVDPYTAGTYLIRYNVIDKYGNYATEVIRTVIVEPDNIPPAHVMNGKEYDTIVVFSTFTDLGTFAYDNCSGLDTIITESHLDNTVLGDYPIYYNAIDVNGNSTMLTRYVSVIDNIAPVITVFDPDTILLDVNTALVPRVLKITDNYYKTFNIITSGTFYENFNTGFAINIGVYTLVYDVFDGSGNKASKTFYVKVLDKTVPDIILKGPRIINLCRFKTFTDPGYEATDDLDKNPVVTTSGNYYTDYLVNFANGWYEMIYTVRDFSGNTSSASRFVAVSDSGICASGISEKAPAPSVLIYPNPSSGTTNVLLSNVQGNVSLYLYDIYGNILAQESYTASNGELLGSLDLSFLPSGNYFLRIVNNDRISVHRLVRK